MKSSIIEEDIQTIVEEIKPIADSLNGKTLLITGGAGFLGNYFILTLDYLNKNILKNPCKMISVDNFITGIHRHLDGAENFKFIKHDVIGPLKLEEPIDFIVHAAGIGSPEYYRKFKIETIDVGVLGTKNMLELAKEKNVESFLFFSSSEVYGSPNSRHVPTPEPYCGNVSCTGPRSNYDESKRLGEALCVAYHEIHNIPVKIVRPFNVFGPGMRKDDCRVVPNFVAHAFDEKPLLIYGQGKHTRTFCYITDATVGFFKVLLSDCNKESFNVGNDDQEITVEELAKIIGEILPGKVAIKKTTGPVDAYGSVDPKRRCPDLTKIKTTLHYSPKVSLREGLERFTQWATEAFNQT